MNKQLLLSLATLGIFTPLVVHANSPYISKVYEYRPAPGQFVNEMPEYESGDTYSTMLLKANEQIAGTKMPGMITLGAFGGYVIFGFDHPLINKPDDYDFKIYGNALISDRNNRGGSSEPGIVLVSADINGNGLPDDPWYELAGSDYNKDTTIKNYHIAYYAPASDHTADPDPDYKYITDRTYIRWSANGNNAEQGYIMHNSYHTQSYWPEWISDKTIEFEGTRLADNFIDISGAGTYYVQVFSDWGYADNLPNGEDKGFNIEWAVDSEGNPVKLDKIDFVKVHTGVNQYCGWLGESSTEVSGAEDLHPEYDPTALASVNADRQTLLLTSATPESITVRSSAHTDFQIYNTNGGLILNGVLLIGENSIDTSTLSSGIYLIHTPCATLKFTR